MMQSCLLMNSSRIVPNLELVESIALWMTETAVQGSSSFIRRLPRKNMTKTDIYWGSYHRHIFVFLISLSIFAPGLEVLLFMNNYLLVCIFKYRTSTRIFSFDFFFKFGVGHLVVLYPLRIIGSSSQRTKIRTPETTKAEVRCHSIPWLRIYYERFCRSFVPFIIY